MTTHLLVTNDFPPKHGGIQSYLWELWRRLPADEVVVLTTPHSEAETWDRTQPYRIERTREKVLLPTPSLGRRIDALADEIGAAVVLLDPALPVGVLGPRLRHPYGLVVHGAEVTVPGRLPGTHLLLRRVLRGASVVIAAGGYPLAEAERAAGRALPAAQPHTEFTTSSTVPFFSPSTASTASAVLVSSTPRRVSSSRIG